MPVDAFNPNVEQLVVLHFQEHNFDQHLRLRPIQVRNDLPDLIDRRVVADDDEISGVIDGHGGVADLTVWGVLLLAGGGSVVGVVVVAAAKTSEPAEATKATEAAA